MRPIIRLSPAPIKPKMSNAVMAAVRQCRHKCRQDVSKRWLIEDANVEANGEVAHRLTDVPVARRPINEIARCALEGNRSSQKPPVS